MAEKDIGAQLYEQLVGLLGRLKDRARRDETASQYCRKQTAANAARLMHEVTTQSLENEGSTGIFCLFLNLPVWLRSSPRQWVTDFRTAMGASGHLKDTLGLFDQCREFEETDILLLQARFNILLQIALILDFRLGESGYPLLEKNLIALMRLALLNLKSNPFELKVQRADFATAATAILESIFEEADFLSVEDGGYTLSLSEGTVEKLASGDALSGQSRTDAMASRISDTMLARQAENLVKRLILAIRGASMYPADHPGLPPLMQSCHSVIQTLLSGKEIVVLTMVGSEFLIDEIRIRKQTRFLQQFAELMEARNISSISFSTGLTVPEVQHLLTIFVQSVAWLKDQGGARLYLAAQGVTHIAMDVYQYGIISMQGQAAGGDGGTGGGGGGGGYGSAGAGAGVTLDSGGGVPGGGPVGGGGGGGLPGGSGGGGRPGIPGMPQRRPMHAELMLLSEIVARVGNNEELTGITIEEIGSLFKKILGGDVERGPELKRSLAELIVSLDPDFLERAIIEQPEVRERLSWTVSRKILNKSLLDLKSTTLKTKLSALEIIAQIGELAIVRNKYSSVTQILDTLTQSFFEESRDHDILFHYAHALSAMASRLILSKNFKMARTVLVNFSHEQERVRTLPLTRDREQRLAIIRNFYQRVSDPDTIKVLVRQLEARDRSVTEMALELLRLIASEEVVTQLLKVFESGSRRERSRAYQTLVGMPAISGESLAWLLSSLRDREIFPRREDNPEQLLDESWYRARNALGVLAEVWHHDAEHVFIDAASDPDPRIRKEVINVLKNAKRMIVADIARDLLRDTHEDVRSLAVLALRTHEGDSAVDDLIEMFRMEPRLREQIIDTLSGIPSPHSRDFFLETLRLRNPLLKRIFLDNPALHHQAIRMIPRFGGEAEIMELGNFVRRLRNPLTYLFHYPLSWVIRSRAIVLTVQDSMHRIREHIVEPVVSGSESKEPEVTLSVKTSV